jgi:hypothetical protein
VKKTIVSALSLFTSLMMLGGIVVGSSSHVVVQAPSQAAAAGNACVTPANPIVAENCKQGNPREEWDIHNYGDLSPNVEKRPLRNV